MRLGESECSHLVSVSWMSGIIYLVGVVEAEDLDKFKPTWIPTGMPGSI